MLAGVADRVAGMDGADIELRLLGRNASDTVMLEGAQLAGSPQGGCRCACQRVCVDVAIGFLI